MRIGGRVFVVGAVPIAMAAAIAVAAIVLLERVDAARTGAALAGTVYRTLLTAVMARNDYLAAGPGARSTPQRRFFALTAQARTDLGRLLALRSDAGPTAEAEATLSRYTEDMNRLVGVTIDGDAMVRDMAARASTLIALSDRAQERQHASNADILSSLAADDRDLRAARDIVDAATAMRLALASIQLGLFDGGAGAGPSARQDNRRLLAADRARVRQLAEDLAARLNLRASGPTGDVEGGRGAFARLDALLDDPAAAATATRPALDAAAQWSERVLKIYAAEYRSFHERVAQLVTYSVQAHEAELATQAIALSISKLSREAAEALARRDVATAGRVLEASRDLADTISNLPISPLIQGDMADAAQLWREGLAKTTERVKQQNALIAAMDAASDDMVRAARLLDAGFGDNAERTAGSIRLILVLGAAGGLLLGTLAAVAVARSITRPLTALQTEIMRAAEDPAGVVDRPAGQRIKGGLRSDELGDIARAADTFLREIARRESALRRAKEKADEALRTLRRTQAELIQAEKMASLGQLVAGVAHEINTPVGIALTTATTLDEEARAFRDGMREGRVSRAALDRLLARVPEGARLLTANLTRAADLIQSFKHVAADQVSGERRSFAVRTFLHEILTSLGPMLRRNGHSATMECPDDLRLDSYPGALAQVVTNLVVNASLHGLAEGEPGLIVVAAEPLDAERLRLIVSDAGRGIAREHAARIFDPFFTTRRAAGSTGLGLHIVFNLVTATLGGRIALDPTAGCGATFVVDLPRTVAATPTRLREETPA